MKKMDRYLFFNFLVSYLYCFISLVGLWIIIDMFANADEFLEDHAGIQAFVRRACLYYSLHTSEYFGRLSPIITQLAAMTTLASLHRHNEIIALLAAGIPTRRILVPILLGVMSVITMGVVNREIIMPHYSDMLQRMHEDIERIQWLMPSPQLDKDQVLIRGRLAHPEDQSLDEVNVTFPMEVVGQLQDVHCTRAFHQIDPANGKPGWLLVSPTALVIQKNPNQRKVKQLANGDIFFYSNVTFEDVTRKRKWVEFASTADLVHELQHKDPKNPQDLRIRIHNNLMKPVLNLLLVLIGIPFVLQWERKDIYRSIAISMILSALFFVIDMTSGYLATYGYLDALSAAWVPVFVFGPLSLSLFHRIGT